MRRKKIPISLILIFLAYTFFLSGCLPDSNHQAGLIDSDSGSLSGIWHGLTAPLSLILSIIFDYNIYEVKNTGWWYNLGFLIGVSVWPFLIGTTIIEKSKNDKPKDKS